MTLYEFNMLTSDEQFKVVFELGTHLHSYKDEGAISYVLYGIDKFYVDVEYNVKENRIVVCKSFKTGRRLERYLDSIILK